MDRPVANHLATLHQKFQAVLTGHEGAPAAAVCCKLLQRDHFHCCSTDCSTEAEIRLCAQLLSPLLFFINALGTIPRVVIHKKQGLLDREVMLI